LGLTITFFVYNCLPPHYTLFKGISTTTPKCMMNLESMSSVGSFNQNYIELARSFLVLHSKKPKLYKAHDMYRAQKTYVHMWTTRTTKKRKEENVKNPRQGNASVSRLSPIKKKRMHQQPQLACVGESVHLRPRYIHQNSLRLLPAIHSQRPIGRRARKQIRPARHGRRGIGWWRRTSIRSRSRRRRRQRRSTGHD
jgi:hypothetical protein